MPFLHAYFPLYTIKQMRGEDYIRIVKSLKRFVGIDDFSLFRKRWKKRIGKLIFHKKYTAGDLVSVMVEMGMKPGSLVCIHSSMMEFYNYRGSAEELISKIIEAIGPDGTLMMPSFHISKDENHIFDPLNDKTQAGYLAETFRKYPGVIRSCNQRAAVCAIGKLADYLTSEHHESDNCWDKKSPWYKLCQNNGLIFNLGLPRTYMGTFHHCVESILKNEHPYWEQFFNKKVVRRFYLNNREEKREYSECTIIRKTREKNIFKYFDSSDMKIRRISNLEIKVFDGFNCLNKMIDLGRKGVSVYSIPSPKEYKF